MYVSTERDLQLLNFIFCIAFQPTNTYLYSFWYICDVYGDGEKKEEQAEEAAAPNQPMRMEMD